MSEGTEGRGLSSMGLLRVAPGGRKGLSRTRARREGVLARPPYSGGEGGGGGG